MRKKRFKISIFPERLNFRFFDKPFFTAVILLSIIGLSFLYSASSAFAFSQKLDTAYFLKKQIIWTIISILIMLFVAFIDLEKIRKYIPFIMIVVIFLLAITLFMPEIQNTRRWIPLKIMNLQTSELAKVAFILYISDYIDKNYSKIKSFKYFIKPFIIIGIMLVLIAVEPDLGTPGVIFITMIIVLFSYGANILYILLPLISGILLGLLEIYRHSYRLDRIKVFLSPWSDPSRKGFQLIQSLIAIGSGWWFGKGPGNSVIKLNYLPQSHTDFIFSIIAEEIGFIGVVGIVSIFLFMFLRAYRISTQSSSSFLSILSYSSILILIIQAFFNIAMTVGLVPTKGIPLPFFSYGGSSIITTMILSGFILNTSLRRRRI